MNADLARQLDAATVGARLWRPAPGQASTRHRHFKTHELYLLVEGICPIRVGWDLHTLGALDCVLVEPDEIRQVFNDTDGDQLWYVVGAPPESAEGMEMSREEAFAWIYPDGPKALPPELDRGPATEQP
jgi:mannose-6-phosphate isomerase-like protein (cupin superfamily)